MLWGVWGCSGGVGRDGGGLSVLGPPGWTPPPPSLAPAGVSSPAAAPAPDITIQEGAGSPQPPRSSRHACNQTIRATNAQEKTNKTPPAPQESGPSPASAPPRPALAPRGPRPPDGAVSAERARRPAPPPPPPGAARPRAPPGPARPPPGLAGACAPPPPARPPSPRRPPPAAHPAGRASRSMAAPEWDWFQREELIGQISDIRVQNLQGTFRGKEEKGSSDRCEDLGDTPRLTHTPPKIPALQPWLRLWRSLSVEPPEVHLGWGWPGEWGWLERSRLGNMGVCKGADPAWASSSGGAPLLPRLSGNRREALAAPPPPPKCKCVARWALRVHLDLAKVKEKLGSPRALYTYTPGSQVAPSRPSGKWICLSEKRIHCGNSACKNCRGWGGKALGGEEIACTNQTPKSSPPPLSRSQSCWTWRGHLCDSVCFP